jgi:pullulanase-type alpha-1,6-glucosidase
MRLTVSGLARPGRVATVLMASALTAGSALHAARAAELSTTACEGEFQVVQHAVPEASRTMEARAAWLDRRLIRWPGAAASGRFRLLHSATGQIVATAGLAASGADDALELEPHTAALPAKLIERLRWLGAGPTLKLRARDEARLPALHRGQLVVVQEDDAGRVLQSTALQTAGALDDLYAAAENLRDLGATPSAGRTAFKLWAPTARQVRLCLHEPGSDQAATLLPMQRHAATGAWSVQVPRKLSGHTYTYLVDVFVRGAGVLRNRVTDPYALSLNADSRRTWIGRLDEPALQPVGWTQRKRPQRALHATDLVVYELHVRDFSASDETVSAAHRGKYLAFTETSSNGMRHLRALAAAGVTDVHLLPVFDLATVPERGCSAPDPRTLAAGAPDSEAQQAAVMADAKGDCFNWGYDPWHFNAPEGSFASNAEDGAVRVLEFRRMVQALHNAGLRVGMDVVYNHTSASGQDPRSVLDRIVPGYYQRLDAQGRVETSTCCANTATEHRMMAKLMIDSAVVWARDYGIDGFRFDLMGHQPAAAMKRLQRAVDTATGRHVHLMGEGWNFGEVKDGARFVQAAQGRLNGTGIGTFSDRGRDAARGGGCCDNAEQTLQRQGWLNGLFHDPNPHASATAGDLLRSADLVRVGLAGTLKDYRMTTADGRVLPLSAIDYAGSGAGYASQPAEVVNYVENHDNQTLFDIQALKLPPATSREDRARVQVLGLALTAFSQGLPYFHAGVELLRSKSGDRNSYDSGDWFNRLDWSYRDNHWGSGLPPKQDNADFWPALKPLLANPAIKPSPEDIAFTRDAFRDLLKIRGSSTLFRLRSAQEVQRRLRFFNTGPMQQATVMVGHLDGRGLGGAGFAEVLYLVNADKRELTLDLAELKDRPFVLHPVHRAPDAADSRPLGLSRWDAGAGTLRVPPRTALVYVVE